jgi:diadenosine tetraphosphate (Ap4A) HIT family hydrolase
VTLDPDEKREIITMMAEAMKQHALLTQETMKSFLDSYGETIKMQLRELAGNVAACECHLTPGEQKQMGHLVNMIGDQAPKETPTDGKLAAGIEEFRANSQFIKAWRRRCEKIGMAVVIAAVTILTGGLFAATWIGLVHKAKTGQ